MCICVLARQQTWETNERLQDTYRVCLSVGESEREREQMEGGLLYCAFSASANQYPACPAPTTVVHTVVDRLDETEHSSFTPSPSPPPPPLLKHKVGAAMSYLLEGGMKYLLT